MEDVSQQKNNDQWLFEEVLGKLVIMLTNFVSYHNGFIKVNKCVIIIILIKIIFTNSSMYTAVNCS